MRGSFNRKCTKTTFTDVARHLVDFLVEYCTLLNEMSDYLPLLHTGHISAL